MTMSFIQIVVAHNPQRNKASGATNHCAVCLCPACLTFDQLTDFLEICHRKYACIITGQPDLVHYICLFICSLLENALSSSEYAALNDWMMRKT